MEREGGGEGGREGRRQRGKEAERVGGRKAGRERGREALRAIPSIIPIQHHYLTGRLIEQLHLLGGVMSSVEYHLSHL